MMTVHGMTANMVSLGPESAVPHGWAVVVAVKVTG